MNETTVENHALAALSPPMQAALHDYAELLQDMAGENLLGLTAYGPVLGPDFDPSVMAASSVLVLERIDLGLLRRLAEHGPTLGRKHVTAPLVMTPAYIESSLDSFPLELLEIHQRHAMLLGKNYFETLAIGAEHLRLQCEREFKRILVRLRQGLLAAGTREDILAGLELDIGAHLLRTLRGLLWLKDRKEWMPNDHVLAESEKLIDQALPGVGHAIHVQDEHGWAEFQSLYADVEKLMVFADEL
ncbi:MAG: hypothetical protein MI923_29015 [Phycisphaerales bacterium]|nr:hypothetical protein [Phycisphaerales bacterium]